jgi:hypothetical protein
MYVFVTKVAEVLCMILYNGLTKQELINKNYNHIYNHEIAHKMAGGQFAGAISIERDANGIPVSGHVPIAMPVLDKNNPQKTIDHANTVIKAALAPSDPSGQDYRVAASAEKIKMKAQTIKDKKTGNKLDVVA